jgi:predicted outer membrane protein
MMLSFRTSAIALALSALCSQCLAQQSAPQKTLLQPRTNAAPAPQTAPRSATSTAPVPQQRVANKPVVTEGNVDATIAGMLALANEEESEVGKYAAEHAKHELVKQFAGMMEKDHAQMADELRKWAPQATLSSDKTRDDSTASERTASDGTRSFNPLNVHRQIANRCLASTKKELGSKSGIDFDLCYIGGQCVMHQQMIDKASVLREYASPELQKSIDKGVSSAEEHLKMAKKLMDDLSAVEKHPSR